MLMVEQQFIFDLRPFVANSTLSQLRAFWGALLAKIWWEGARKHFIRPGCEQPPTQHPFIQHLWDCGVTHREGFFLFLEPSIPWHPNGSLLKTGAVSPL